MSQQLPEEDHPAEFCEPQAEGGGLGEKPAVRPAEEQGLLSQGANPARQLPVLVAEPGGLSTELPEVALFSHPAPAGGLAVGDLPA